MRIGQKIGFRDRLREQQREVAHLFGSKKLVGEKEIARGGSSFLGQLNTVLVGKGKNDVRIEGQDLVEIPENIGKGRVGPEKVQNERIRGGSVKGKKIGEFLKNTRDGCVGTDGVQIKRKRVGEVEGMKIVGNSKQKKGRNC